MSPHCLIPPTGAAAKAARARADQLPHIETERLRLRAPTLADFPLWSSLMQGPDAPRLGGPLSEEQAYEAFCVYVAGWLLHGHGLWAVEHQRTLIGFVLIGLEWSDDAPELGWMLHDSARGQGFGTEAARAALAHGRALGLSMVSYIDPDNRASAALAARLGATRDAAAEAAHGDGTQVWSHDGGTA